jgi:HEAT repeat protein
MQLRDLLTGGDRRSVAQAEEALAIARQDRKAVNELARLTTDPDPLVASRSLDVLEKLVHEVPEWVEPHRMVFLHNVDHEYWEARLQCARAIPLLNWNPNERIKLIKSLRQRIDDDQKFVRCWALDSFAQLVGDDTDLREELDRHLASFLNSGVPSMVARARAIVKRMTRARLTYTQE